MKKQRTYNFKFLKSKIDILISLLDKSATKHPIFVIIIMHELFRSLYPYDPYINNKKVFNNNSLKLKDTLDNLINIAKSIDNIGYYPGLTKNKLIFNQKININRFILLN